MVAKPFGVQAPLRKLYADRVFMGLWDSGGLWKPDGRKVPSSTLQTASLQVWEMEGLNYGRTQGHA
jgi:hypothetical protein